VGLGILFVVACTSSHACARPNGSGGSTSAPATTPAASSGGSGPNSVAVSSATTSQGAELSSSDTGQAASESGSLASEVDRRAPGVEDERSVSVAQDALQSHFVGPAVLGNPDRMRVVSPDSRGSSYVVAFWKSTSWGELFLSQSREAMFSGADALKQFAAEYGSPSPSHPSSIEVGTVPGTSLPEMTITSKQGESAGTMSITVLLGKGQVDIQVRNANSSASSEILKALSADFK
jgi:hypothetical protein